MDHAKRARLLWALALITLSSATTWRSAAQSTQHELENVEAFSRLYGVIRFFYPGDAAANADWNRLAVDGVARIRTAPDSTALAARLRNIFEPLGPGIEIASSLPAFHAPVPTTEPLVAWRYFGPGATTPRRGTPYRAKRTNRTLRSGVASDGFALFTQSLAALDFRGKSVRLRGLVRAAVSDNQSGGALWLRVDRGDNGIGCLDNMMNRLVREAAWREYVIQCDVADDATGIVFGVMAFGGATADFDALEVSVPAANGAWRAVPITDGGFEAESATAWSRVGTMDAQITRGAEGAPEGRQFVRFVPRELAGLATAELFPELPPVFGDHIDVDLAAGLRARVALTLTDAQAKAGGSATTATVPASDQDRGLADIVVAWNFYRHFYPYFAEASVDWDALLGSQLKRAYDASTRAGQAEALRRLVADARDGHGTVADAQQRPRAAVPVQVAFIDSRLVVVASRAPAVPVGSVITAVDGTSANDRFVTAMPLVSGSLQWRQYRAAQEIAVCTGATARLTIDDGGATQTVDVPCGAVLSPPVETRPAPIAEVVPGIWYVDLTRAITAELTPKIDSLAAARGVIFDVRGYPTDACRWVLPHLLDTPETDRWMHVAKIVGPFGRMAGWQSIGWNLTPAAPRLAGKVVFLTDGRAISYAESVMGYIAGRHLATIVGSPTAATNGNIATFQVPGESTIAFTGMRVTGHDGLAVHHLVGVKPDVTASPTLAGIRAGRDEVLDRALSLLR
jgi:Peptidase family S41